MVKFYRWTFRIVYLSSDNSEVAATTAAATEYKKLDFEADSRAAVEIHSKLSHLIDWQPTKSRQGSLCTGLGLKMVPRLRECCRQSQAELVSKSRNNIHQTWGPPYSRAL